MRASQLRPLVLAHQTSSALIPSHHPGAHQEPHPIKLEKINFDEDRIVWPEVLDWSRSNLSRLYDVGYKAGADFYDQHRALFSDHSA